MGNLKPLGNIRRRRNALAIGMIDALILPFATTAGEYDFGVTAAVYGDVRFADGAGNISSGAKVVPGSTLTTGADSGLQILFSVTLSLPYMFLGPQSHSALRF